jgi:protein-disulfide isomerase
MSVIDRIIVGTVIVAVGLVGINIYKITQASATSIPPVEQIKIPLNTIPNLVRNEPLSGKYVLVEFGDYECPPCGMAHKVVHDFLGKHPDVGFVFHQFPLTMIHPHAMPAAKLAEAAREQGKFREIHDFLYTKAGNVSEKEVSEFLQQQKMDEKRFQTFIKTKAENLIRSEMRFAQKVGINGTPTFFLLSPDGKFETVSPQDLESKIK